MAKEIFDVIHDMQAQGQPFAVATVVETDIEFSFEGAYMDTPFQVRKAAPFPVQPYRPLTLFPLDCHGFSHEKGKRRTFGSEFSYLGY